MRSGIWPAAATACALLGAWTASATAGGFHTIPRLTPALDYRTGEQYYAPPIPYGHYVGKDIPGHVLGAVHGSVGLAAGAVHSPFGLIRGKLGGLFHGRGGCGVHGCGGHGCGDSGGAAWGDDSGSVGPGSDYAPSFDGPTPVIQGQTFDTPAPMIQGQPAGQIVPMSGEILGGSAPDRVRMIRDPALRGTGWGPGEASGQFMGLPQAGAYGPGLPIDGPGHAGGPSWDNYQGADAGCDGHGGSCHRCGGHGAGGLLSFPHALLGTVRGLPHTALGAAHGVVGGVVGTVFHHGDIDYFTGPGGPVPLTPGYVPYIVTTRSPRDFLSFPPFSNVAP